MRIRPAEACCTQWLADRTRYQLAPDFRALEALDGAGKTCALIAFDHWTPNSAHIHIAADSPIFLRRLLLPAVQFAFGECGLALVVGMMRATAKSVAIAKHFGFRLISHIRDGWAKDEDTLIFELRREWCSHLFNERPV